ncbi:MAG: hypothetical protein GEU74_09360 [Nitriliruptorales bacterium]|nr:hypothetical protein [Nitriliruptorales bacterium]
MTSRWAQRWMEVFDDANPQIARRFAQGHNLVRSGRVSGVQVGRGIVTGSVQGFSATPLAVEVGVPALPDEQWERVVEALASQVRHRARLLAGQVPDGLDVQLEAQGLSLLPRADEVDVTCRCGDALVPCVHAAAVWQALAGEIDADPFVLLRIRGRGRERLLAESAAVRAVATPQEEPGRDIAALDARWWVHAPKPVDDLLAHPPEPPRTPAGPLRLLGDPPGWTGGVSAGDLFAPLIQRGAAWALALLDEEPG